MTWTIAKGVVTIALAPEAIYYFNKAGQSNGAGLSSLFRGLGKGF